MCTGEDSTHCSWYPKRGICSSRAKNREVLLLVTPRRALSISRPWALRKLGKCLGKGRIEKKRVPIWWLCICSLSMNNKYSTLYSIGVCMDSGTGVSLSQPSTSGWKGLNDLHYKLFKKITYIAGITRGSLIPRRVLSLWGQPIEFNWIDFENVCFTTKGPAVKDFIGQ